jgi:protein-tyrosine-phosphatase
MRETMTASQRLRVLFLCTGNAARSQMAEALLRNLSKGRADVFCGGSAPERQVHPLAKSTLRGEVRHRSLRPATEVDA